MRSWRYFRPWCNSLSVRDLPWESLYLQFDQQKPPVVKVVALFSAVGWGTDGIFSLLVGLKIAPNRMDAGGRICGSMLLFTTFSPDVDLILLGRLRLLLGSLLCRHSFCVACCNAMFHAIADIQCRAIPLSWPWCKVFLRVLLVVGLVLVLVLLVLCVQLRFLPQGRVHSGSPEVGFAQHC